MRDLRPRGRDEPVEDVRGDVLLRRPEPGERAVEMLADDRLGPAERGQRLQPERVGARLALRVPEALEHELEERRLDVRLPHAAVRLRAPAVDQLEPPGRDLVQHRLDELGLDLHVLAGHLLEGAQRARAPRARAASRSRWSSRSEFPNRFAIRPLKASSIASVSSRMESRTLTRSPRSREHRGELRAERPARRRRGRGSTPRTDRGSRRRTRPRCRRRAARARRSGRRSRS